MDNMPRDDKVLRIGSWNIDGGYKRDYGGEYAGLDLGYVYRTLHEHDLDIIGLQEAHTSQDSIQAATLAHLLNMHYVSYAHAPSHIEEGKELSVAILSRYPIVSSQFVITPNPQLVNGRLTTHDKGFIISTIEVDETAVSVLCGHTIPFWRFGRQASEFSEVYSHIERMVINTASPAIVLADMNEARIDQLMPKIFSAGFHDALPPGPTRLNGKKSDYILVRGMQPMRAQIVATETDHYLCTACFATLQNP
jgi:endonuclease/exonuclease/phosphatase family metal-dependent hydrolase